MNDQLENRLSMLQKVQAYLALRLTEFSSVPDVAATSTELTNVVNNILTSAGVSQADITGYTVQKANMRAELTAAVLKVSAGYVAWASLSNQPQESEKADATPAMLDAMRDNDLYTYAQYLHTIATPPVADLADYGVTPADMTELNSTAQDYLELIQEPKLRIGARGAELINLTRLFDQAMGILINKLDKLMPIFRNTNPTLYDEYIFARGIDDTGTPSLPDYEANIPGSSLQLVATIGHSASRDFRVRNTGSTTLIFSLSNNPAVLQGAFATITPGNEVNNNTNTLNPDITADKILLQNTEPGVGSYKIWITE